MNLIDIIILLTVFIAIVLIIYSKFIKKDKNNCPYKKERCNCSKNRNNQ